ncbi:MAG: SPOR domain-containing protein [Acidobacteriia bacterium]|nr:SPOR domain-containing protein [Terriglobia bacterium]
MAKNEEGEFELILGNRQLISVFLIVVILLGVFFSMGYIVGRNSAPAAAETARDNKPVEVHWPPPDSAKTPDAASQEPAIATPVPADVSQAKAAPPESTTPEAAPPAAPVVPKATPTPPPAPPEKPRASGPPVTAPASAGEPAPGDYWQVVATARPDAEIITETLSKKGFHAVLAPAPKDGVFRVLVGPLKDSAAQAQTRTALEAAGFKNPIVRKY